MIRKPLDDLGTGDPGLTELFGALTSEPSSDELAGEFAAVRMFRTARAGDAGPATPLRQARRRVSRARVGGRLVAAATAVALAGGFAAAGYAEALPSPLQHLAHQILGFAGVPNKAPGKNGSSPAVPVASSGSNPAAPGSPRPGTSSRSQRSSSPSPRRTSSSPGRGGSITIAATERQVAAGASVRITASFARAGQTVAGVPLRLGEMPAGQTGWHVAGRASTGSRGQAGFTVGRLTTNASFRVTGPDRTTSAELSIVVIPAISVSDLQGSRGRSQTLVVSAPLAQIGDVVRLEYLADGQWLLLRSHQLRRGGQADFSVVPRKISVTYRVVLPATVEHGQSVSLQVTIAASRPKGGGQDRNGG